jgi:hypothetical protein
VPTSAGAAYLLWSKPPLPEVDSDDAPPGPRAANDHWLLMDLAKKVSEDLGEAPFDDAHDVNAGGDGVYVTNGLQVARVRISRGRASIESGARADPDAMFDAISSAGSTARIEDGTLCLAKPGDKQCTTIVPLPDADTVTWRDVQYTSEHRVVVSSTEGDTDVHAVGMGVHPIAYVIDGAKKAATRLPLAGVGTSIAVSNTGRVAWTVAEGGRLRLAVAPLDNVAAAKTYDIGPATAQAEAVCGWGGSRVVCVVAYVGTLFSVDTLSGTSTTLLERNAIWTGFVVSNDGTWVVFLVHDGPDSNTWHLSPTDKAGAVQALPLDDSAHPLAFL